VTIVWFLCAFYVGMFAGVFIMGLARAAGERTPSPVESSARQDGHDVQDHEFAA
jgi:hypothetical protein